MQKKQYRTHTAILTLSGCFNSGLSALNFSRNSLAYNMKALSGRFGLLPFDASELSTPAVSTPFCFSFFFFDLLFFEGLLTNSGCSSLNRINSNFALLTYFCRCSSFNSRYLSPIFFACRTTTAQREIRTQMNKHLHLQSQ